MLIKLPCPVLEGTIVIGLSNTNTQSIVEQKLTNFHRQYDFLTVSEAEASYLAWINTNENVCIHFTECVLE